MTVVLVEGRGTLFLRDRPFAMGPGDIAFVPRGVPHYFVNEGTAPATAVASFAPPFSGPDMAPAREEPVRP